ncbi:MAG: hypothetical protein WCG19_11220 [Chlorobiaceae bacterium]
MGAKPDLIPGIYNYCDRWCERCAYTSRCLQFQIESEESKSSDSLSDFDVLNAGFWEDMGDALVKAMRLIREIAAKEGIDPEDLDKETAYSELCESFHRNAREHPCASAALVYSGMVNEWFAALDDVEAEEAHPANYPLFLDEHLQVIRHYQYFIYPKIVRAIEGRLNEPFSAQDEAQNDACGSAKVALIAIDRSLASWSILYAEYPDYEDKTLSILVHLDRLRRSLEVVFPAARAFLRPGFDS